MSALGPTTMFRLFVSDNFLIGGFCDWLLCYVTVGGLLKVLFSNSIYYDLTLVNKGCSISSLLDTGALC